MAITVTFSDYRPAPRYPPILTPWTQAEIQESATKDAWVTIDTIDLDPVDSDPTRPRHRDFSTGAATLPEAWYRIVWLDAEGTRDATEPKLNSIGVLAASWAPSVQDVADLSPAYTRYPVDGDGQQAGAQQKTFDDQTDPTQTQVLALIAVAVREVVSRTGVSIALLEQYGDLAKTAAAWHAAATIEAEKAPDGADETTGAYAWKQASYVACLNELIRQARPTLVG